MELSRSTRRAGSSGASPSDRPLSRTPPLSLSSTAVVRARVQRAVAAVSSRSAIASMMLVLQPIALRFARRDTLRTPRCREAVRQRVSPPRTRVRIAVVSPPTGAPSRRAVTPRHLRRTAAAMMMMMMMLMGDTRGAQVPRDRQPGVLGLSARRRVGRHLGRRDRYGRDRRAASDRDGCRVDDRRRRQAALDRELKARAGGVVADGAATVFAVVLVAVSTAASSPRPRRAVAVSKRGLGSTSSIASAPRCRAPPTRRVSLRS